MRLTVRQIRLGLWSIAILCVAGGAAIACISIVLPLEQRPGGSSVQIHHVVHQTGDGGALPLSAYAPVWDIELRRPLVDAPPPPAAAAPQAAVEPAPPPFHLAGTIVEPGHSVALFQTPGGKTEFKSIGQEINGATVVAITDGAATLRWYGRRIVASVERASPGMPATAKADEDR